jgi:hypothetical protein
MWSTVIPIWLALWWWATGVPEERIRLAETPSRLDEWRANRRTKRDA